MTRWHSNVLILACLLAAPAAAHAADSNDAPPAVERDTLAPARKLIAERKWPAVVAELRRVNDTRSADWHNLMGYALRKSAAPDLAAAERHYLDALRIDPRHIGALEYIGELHLMQGDLAKAESRTAELARVCARGCPELDDLRQEIGRFKANGNRWVTKP